LGLASDFLYPVVISVSVLTTFTTPFCIKYAEQIYALVRKVLPEKVQQKMDSYTSDTQTEQEKDSHWKRFLQIYFAGLLIYGVVILGIIQFGLLVALPFLSGWIPGIGAKLLCTLLTLLLIAPFIYSLLHQRNKELTLLLIRGKNNRLPMLAFMSARLTVAVGLVMYAVNALLGVPLLWLVLPALGIIVFMSRSGTLFGRYLQIEARFLANFNEKQLTEWALTEKGECIGCWLSDELWVGQYRLERHVKQGDVPKSTFRRFIERARGTDDDPKLSDLIWRRFYSINVIKIISRKRHINIPENTQKLHVGDILFLLGTKSQIDSFHDNVDDHPNVTDEAPPVPLREFIAKQDQEHEEQQLLCFALDVDKSSEFLGKSIKDSNIRKKWNCLVVGVQRDIYPIVYPDIQTILSNGDKVWVVGSQKTFNKLVQAGLIEADVEGDLEAELEKSKHTR
jgi:CPA2 family monovalent cation:H+ antiporter-2